MFKTLKPLMRQACGQCGVLLQTSSPGNHLTFTGFYKSQQAAPHYPNGSWATEVSGEGLWCKPHPVKETGMGSWPEYCHSHSASTVWRKSSPSFRPWPVHLFCPLGEFLLTLAQSSVCLKSLGNFSQGMYVCQIKKVRSAGRKARVNCCL